MGRGKLASAVGILLGFAAIPAQGQQIIFGANVGARWDSNVNNVPHGDSDFSARVGPEVRFLKPEGDLTYDFHYVPTYQAYSRFASLDDWDQLVNTTVSYQLGLNTQLQFRDLFEYAPVTTNFLQQITAPAGVPLGTQVVNAIGRYNVLVNTASIDLQHQWTELWKSEGTVTSFYYDPRVTNAISNNNTSASGNLTYAITQRDFIGAALGFTLQQFGGNAFQSSSTSYFYNASAVWNHDFSPTWSLKMQAGPTWVNQGSISTQQTATVNPFPTQSVGGVPALVDFRTCVKLLNGTSFLNQCGSPTLLAVSLPLLGFTVTSPTAQQVASTTTVPIVGQPSSSSNSLTYFANILMSKRWETVTGTLGYSRSAGSSGVFTTSTEVDAVTGTLSWEATPLWTTDLSLVWSDQSSTSNNSFGLREAVVGFPYAGVSLVTGLPVSTQTPKVTSVVVQQQRSTINVYQVIIGLHSQYRLTKRLSVFSNVFFLNQNSSAQGGQGLNLSNLNYNATRIDLGFHYEFDPIYL